MGISIYRSGFTFAGFLESPHQLRTNCGQRLDVPSGWPTFSELLHAAPPRARSWKTRLGSTCRICGGKLKGDQFGKRQSNMGRALVGRPVDDGGGGRPPASHNCQVSWRQEDVSDQQILGSGSPTNISRTREPPTGVRRITMQCGSALTVPITAECSPSG